jgi:SAM-dependent methyltransferase
VTAFPTAPPWYRPFLSASGAALRVLLPVLQGSDSAERDEVAHHVRHPELAHHASERMVPQTERGRDRNMPLHTARYAWALAACEGKDVVDLGCGVGYGTVILSSFARSAVGVDVSPDAIEAARKLYPEVDYRISDLISGELPAAEVGVCFEVLEHLHEPERAIHRFLDAYPHLLLSFPNPLASGSHINPHHVVDWPLTTLKSKLREAGARHIEVYRQGYYSAAIRKRRLGPALTWVIDARRDGGSRW